MIRTNHLPRDAWSKRILAYWLERVPEPVARSQTAYERGALAYRLQKNGVSLQRIADHFNLSSRERVRQMLWKHERERKWMTPVEKFFATHLFFTDIKTTANKWAGQTGPRIDPKRCAYALSCALASFNPSNSPPKSSQP
jgi:hypothetical protein